LFRLDLAPVPAMKAHDGRTSRLPQLAIDAGRRGQLRDPVRIIPSQKDLSPTPECANVAWIALQKLHIQPHGRIARLEFLGKPRTIPELLFGQRLDLRL